MNYRSLRGSFTTTIRPGDLTPDDLEHLEPADLKAAIEDQRYWKAMKPEGEPTTFAIPFGQGGYAVVADENDNIRTVMYDPSFEHLQGVFDRAYDDEPETTVLYVGLG